MNDCPWIGGGPLSPAARARLERLERGVTDPPVPTPDLNDHRAVAAWRERMHDEWGEGTVADEVVHERVLIAGVPCLVAGRPDQPIVVYLHGGAFALGSAGVAAPITARLARTLRVVSVDYRLVPEHPFPAALDDALAVFLALLDTSCCGGANGQVSLAGDSAGAALAVGTSVLARDRGLARPSCLVLLSPLLDLRGSGREHGSLLTAYRGKFPPEHPLVSPGLADLIGMPPVLLQTGTLDALLGQSIRFARRARVAGVDVTLDVWDGLWHTWHYHRDIPEADLAISEAADFISGHGVNRVQRAGITQSGQPSPA